MVNEKIYQKLVRDHIPSIIQASGRQCRVHQAGDREYVQRLQEKVLEEWAEFLENPCPEEAADLYEVLSALFSFHGFDPEDIETLRQAKQKKNGGFARRLVLESTWD